MYGIEHRDVSRRNEDEAAGDEEEENDQDMAAWERTYVDERSWESLQEDESGLLFPIDEKKLYHAQFRRRLHSISSATTTSRIQKGLLRYMYIVVDFSRVMLDSDSECLMLLLMPSLICLFEKNDTDNL